jgi:hypothetical protein
MKYKIIEARTHENLAARVQEVLDSGLWQPLGGVTTAYIKQKTDGRHNETGYDIFLQAMILTDDTHFGEHTGE